jgi:urea carboxylase
MLIACYLSLLCVVAVQLDTRVLHLPMSFDDSSCTDAISKYMSSFRNDAPYLPSNIDFVARNNGITRADVHRTVFDASYMVLGLGDVYLGAPCAVPLNPLQRLIVPKYNPARTMTPEGAVGLGGAYMCIYPMTSPGGYQLIGRTLPIWSTFGNMHQRHPYLRRTTASDGSPQLQSQPLFTPSKPWLLEMFDEIRFFPVDESELNKQRDAFRSGYLPLKVESARFSMREYNQTWSAPEQVAKQEAMRKKQKEAQKREMEEDAASLKRIAKQQGSAAKAAPGAAAAASADASGSLLSGQHAVHADVTARVVSVLVKVGDRVRPQTPLVRLEAMKMEYTLRSSVAGTVTAVHAQENGMVQQGQRICVIQEQ